MAAKWTKINLGIPNDLRPKDRERLADLVIEHIYDRTNEGVDKKGKPFVGYSESYMKSLDFKNAGKGRQPNLQLSGDMLAAMKLLSHKNGSLTVGFDKGTRENAVAEGNILGTYGSDKPAKKKARDFLGISDKKLRELITHVRSD